jgi:hypothetical protein
MVSNRGIEQTLLTGRHDSRSKTDEEQETEGSPVCTERKTSMKNQANHKNQQPEFDASQLGIVELSDEQLDGVTGGGADSALLFYELGAHPEYFANSAKLGAGVVKQGGQTIKQGLNGLKNKL